MVPDWSKGCSWSPLPMKLLNPGKPGWRCLRMNVEIRQKWKEQLVPLECQLDYLFWCHVDVLTPRIDNYTDISTYRSTYLLRLLLASVLELLAVSSSIPSLFIFYRNIVVLQSALTPCAFAMATISARLVMSHGSKETTHFISASSTG